MIVVGRNIDGLLGLPRSSFPPGELDLAGQSRRSVRCLLSPSFPGKVFLLRVFYHLRQFGISVVVRQDQHRVCMRPGGGPRARAR